MANNRKIVLRATLESGWSASSGSGRKSDAGLSRNHIATEELSVSSERNEAVGNAPTGKGKASKKRKKKGRKANRLDSAMEGTEPTTVTDDTDGFAQNPSQITFASGKLFDLGVLNKLQLARWYTLSSGGSSDLGKLSAWAEIAEAAPFKLNTGLNRRVLMVTEKDTPGSQKKKKRKNDDQEKQPSEPKPKQIPHTLETLREKDATTVAVDDEEVLEDEQTDEMGSYFQRATAPRLLVTTSDKARKRSIALARELAGVIPNAEYKSRRRFALKKIIPECVTHGITDIIVINENRDKPDALTLCHLPNGPTAVFKLRSVKLTKEIKNVGEMTDHHPEVILTNFSTRLGHTVGRMFASLFPHDPNFQGRRAVTFYNQRDFVFFRNHRYIFRNAERVGLQELGPKFTMKLRSLQKGTFDSMQGEYLWIHKQLEMNKSRRKFFL